MLFENFPLHGELSLGESPPFNDWNTVVFLCKLENLDFGKSYNYV